MIFAINWSTFKIIGKYGLIVLGLLMLVFLTAVATPYMARFIDKLRSKPERVGKKGAYDFDKDGLKSVYGIDSKKNENGDESQDGKR